MNNKLIIFSSFIVLFFFFVLLFFIQRKSPSQNQPVVPSPTSVPSTQSVAPFRIPVTPSPTTIQDRPVPPEDFLLNLPFQSETFSVEYFKPERTILISISQSPYEEIKEKALQWMRSKGLRNEGSYHIIYVKPRFLN